jgi:hypothetical protein
VDNLEESCIAIRNRIEEVAADNFGNSAFKLESIDNNQDRAQFRLSLISGESIDLVFSRIEISLYRRMSAMRSVINNWIKKRIISESEAYISKGQL